MDQTSRRGYSADPAAPSLRKNGSLNQGAIDAIARNLFRAETERKTLPPVSEAHPEMTVACAYGVQRAGLAIRGRPNRGFKLGYTSAAMRAQMGIAEPNYGELTMDHLEHASLTRLDASGLVHPLVEPEIALLLERALVGPDTTRADAWTATAAAAPALEIVDTRYHRYDFNLLDNIADNSSSARARLGGWTSRNALPDLRTVGCELWNCGDVLARGVGGDVLGDPFLALAWLADTLFREGRSIPAGSIVLTGGLTRAFPLKGGDMVGASFAGLGEVRMFVEKPEER